MGDLRNFIKSRENKVKGKLGKAVKCFDMVEAVDAKQVKEEWDNRMGE